MALAMAPDEASFEVHCVPHSCLKLSLDSGKFCLELSLLPDLYLDLFLDTLEVFSSKAALWLLKNYNWRLVAHSKL